MTGHCSRCGKVWTLDTAQGVCQWCGKQAQCQTATATTDNGKTRRRQRPERPALGKGYDRLAKPYLTYYRVALRYASQVPPDDQEDLLHDTILTLEQADQSKPLSDGAMYRIASLAKAQYWRTHYQHTNGLTCGNCSKAQRQKCKESYLYGDCPKAVKLESLNRPVIDSEGNMTELGELIADDTALDIPQWCEINEQLLHAPDRALLIAGKIQDGEKLTPAESRYLYKLRRKLQKNLL